jgi:hypothetical protein
MPLSVNGEWVPPDGPMRVAASTPNRDRVGARTAA